VFNKGTPNPSITSTPTWGQSDPTSSTGIKEKVKKPQKKEAKNITSDTINKAKATRAVLAKSDLMKPTRDSLLNSHNQKNNLNEKPKNPTNHKYALPPDNTFIKPKTVRPIETDIKIGNILSFSSFKKESQTNTRAVT
jgi:hypothetical protein